MVGHQATKTTFKKKDTEKKEDQFYEHCKVQGHLKENCFKIIGYPDWYVDLLKIKREKKVVKQVNMTEAKIDKEKSMTNNQEDWIAKLIKQEVAKALKASEFGNEDNNIVNFILTSDYTGMTKFSALKERVKGSWMVETGVSSHICVNWEFFDDLTTLSMLISIHLPNGTITQVTQVGSILFNGIRLIDTLLIPYFTHNLLSVNKLTFTNLVSCAFFPNFCLLQEVLVVGRVVGHLYYLDHFSFSSDILQHFNKPDLLQQYIANSFFESTLLFFLKCTMLYPMITFSYGTRDLVTLVI